MATRRLPVGMVQQLLIDEFALAAEQQIACT
jgi:hypothetical protein